MTHPYPPRGTRILITVFIMAAAIMNQVDTTIVNVALPHIQGSTSASPEQIAWVLTSYIVSLAIFTPLTGWLGSRIGRRRVILSSILFFTIASGLCGMAVNLDELILFRILQGMSGAALVPLSQATLFDINPPEKHGQAMAIFGLAAVTGPLFGPLLGGWLTSNFSWRWCFFINLPIGLFSWIGLSAFMPEWRDRNTPRLDLLGFGLLALGIGATQLMLDRGQLKDWFGSTEICIEAALAAVGFYLFVVHSFTKDKPFVSPAVFADRNFVICTLVGFFLGMLIYAPMALLPQMLENLMGYPIMEVGIVMAPRGLGILFTMIIMARIIQHIDYRIWIVTGLGLSAVSQLELSHMSLQADSWLVVVSGFVQGAGSSMVFVPLSALAFATLPARYRNEGAALNSLVRYFGSSVGIAATQFMTVRNTATVQSRLVEGIRPDNPAVRLVAPSLDLDSPTTAARMAREVYRQAMMVSYVDVFWAMFLIALVACLLVLLLKSPPKTEPG